MHLRMIYGNELFVIHPVVLIMPLYNPQWKAYCSTHPVTQRYTENCIFAVNLDEFD